MFLEVIIGCIEICELGVKGRVYFGWDRKCGICSKYDKFMLYFIFYNIYIIKIDILGCLYE